MKVDEMEALEVVMDDWYLTRRSWGSCLAWGVREVAQAIGRAIGVVCARED